MGRSMTCTTSIAAVVIVYVSQSTSSAFTVRAPVSGPTSLILTDGISSRPSAALRRPCAFKSPLNTQATPRNHLENPPLSSSSETASRTRQRRNSEGTRSIPTWIDSSFGTRTSSSLRDGKFAPDARQRHERIASGLGMKSGAPWEGVDGSISKWMETGKRWFAGVALAGALLGGGAIISPLEPSLAATPAETKEIGLCLLGQCQAELTQCLLNPKCLANIICLQTCNGRSDEGYCQIRCGDLFENEVVGKFNACAVSKKNCVKQRQDDGSWPVPPVEAQVTAFDTKLMEGQWYISAGLNPAFDCFDCQVHFFNSPKPGMIVGKLNWRIKEPDGEFFTRDVVQKFKQDSKNPAHLVNKDNEYLHYRDDWYILDAEPDSHVLVVYRGSNDAWDGYGGGTLYTKEKSVPPKLVERLKSKSEAAGVDWSRWQYNDNTCKPQSPEISEMLRERYAKKLLVAGGEQLQEQLTAARGFASQELDDVEASTLDKLEDLRQTYEIEVEQLAGDLTAAFEAELRAFEAGLAGEVKNLAAGAMAIEEQAEELLGVQQ